MVRNGGSSLGAYELRWRAEENLREAFRVMARYAADGAVLEIDGACHIATGIPNAFFNPVFLLHGAPPDDVEGFQRRARAFYQARGGLPWSMVLTAGDEEPPLTPDRLRDAGMAAAGSVPVLSRSTTRADIRGRQNREVVIERVEAGEQLAEHRDVLAEAFGLPGFVTEMLLPDLPPPTMRLYNAYLDGDPVGTVSLFDAAGVAGIYNLGVLPGNRRQGIASALLRRVLDEACWELGLAECVVQTPRAALPLFREVGFEWLAACVRYVEPQHMPPGEGKKRS
jgi:GNAT superfamily N-acetyltransferase